MPLVPNFTAQQTGTNPTSLALSDSSTGSDVAITQRRIYLLQANGSYLVPSGVSTDYIQWALADTTKTIADLLSVDVALSILVQWLNVANAVLYSKTILYALPAFGENFDLALAKQMASTPNIINSTDWFNNKIKMRVCIDSGDQAVSQGNDIYSAQSCYDLGSYLQNKSNLLY